MDVGAAFAAAGVWPAVPLTGYLVLRRTTRCSPPLSPPTAAALITVAGLAVWSLPLLGSVVLGVYRPAYLGIAGWAVAAVSAVAVWRDRRSRGAQPRAPWDAVLVVGLLAAAGLYLGFPSESIYGGRDEGVYANHAVFMAHHGRLDVPYPWPADADGIFAEVWNGFPGFYNTPGAMTVQFGHLFPAWLAHAFATLGPYGLFRLNGVFAVLALAVIYDVFQRAVGPLFAVVATLFLAFNPSELWVARITLSEIVVQLFVWSGICFLLRALQEDRPAPAAWAGVCFGMSALVRFDSLLLLPMLLLAHLGYRLVVEPVSRSRTIWQALYASLLPLFALSAAYFFIFSRPYLMQRIYVRTLVIASGSAALLLLASRPALVVRLRPWLVRREILGLVGAGVLLLSVYAYWIRPLPVGPPRMVYQWPGFSIDLSKGNYRADSLVDLARYLSPAVVWAAIGGWYVSLWQVVRGKSAPYLVVPLIVIAGFSVAYLYDHFNTPDHLWWIRRFVPLVVPGFILYAAVGVKLLLERLPAQLSAAAAACALVFLVAFTGYSDRLILTFAENQGLFSQLEHLAQRLPAGVPIVMHAHKSWVTPLYVAFDRHVIPLDLSSADGQQAWRNWATRCTEARQAAYLVFEIDEKQQPVADTDVTLSRAISEHTVGRLPQRVLPLQSTFRVAKVEDPKRMVFAPPTSEHPDR